MGDAAVCPVKKKKGSSPGKRVQFAKPKGAKTASEGAKRSRKAAEGDAPAKKRTKAGKKASRAGTTAAAKHAAARKVGGGSGGRGGDSGEDDSFLPEPDLGALPKERAAMDLAPFLVGPGEDAVLVVPAYMDFLVAHRSVRGFAARLARRPRIALSRSARPAPYGRHEIYRWRSAAGRARRLRPGAGSRPP